MFAIFIIMFVEIIEAIKSVKLVVPKVYQNQNFVIRYD